MKAALRVPSRNPGVTFNSDGQGLAFSGDEGAPAQLDPIQAVVVALVGALGAGKGEGDRRGEGGERLAHRAVGADQPQLEGAPGVLVRRGAGDVEAVAFDDGTSRGLRGRVVPVLGGQEFHCAQSDRKRGHRPCYRRLEMTTWRVEDHSPTVMLMELLGGESSVWEGKPPLIL